MFGNLLPSVSLWGLQLNLQSKAAQRGPTVRLFWLRGQKRSKFKIYAIFHSHPLLLLPQAQIHFPDSCGQLQPRSKTAEATGLGVEWGYHISAEPALAFFTDFRHFSWVFGKWKWGGRGKHLSPVTWGCLLLATHRQPVATIMVLSHLGWTSFSGLQPMRPSWSIWKRVESLRQERSLLHFKVCWNLAAWVLVWLHRCAMHFLKVNCSPFGSGPVILGYHLKCHSLGKYLLAQASHGAFLGMSVNLLN